MKNTSTWWIKIPLIFFLIFGLTEFFVDSGDIPAFIKYPMVQVFLVFILFLLIAIAVITSAIEKVMFQTLSEEGQERYLAAKNKTIEWKWAQRTYQKMLGSKPMEKEEEIILDHNYDGIRELDNNLPPWWVYLFYASIVFAVIYMVRFHVFNDYTQDQEYEQEVAAAKLEIEEYKKTAKGLVDANTVELLTDASDLKAGQAIFESNCVACHMADGGGGIGPNLTDQNWILGGGIKNVFHTISEGGRDGKGMIAWKQNLKPAEIAQVASYVLSFQGTTAANPKAAEGDLWIDPNAPAPATPAEETSTEQEIDSTSVTMN
ncbi:cytochrome C oxidase subunit III [Zobellia amurskyensis]|uniref:Cytochrome C oxidase subunit III n=1 Tax=Zobellia amurskyensis TaxID=248905 RepID=A0A7X3D070_9FLAO|nr:cbb3-type cytochrome c oxidase N-terminal domain-containing protein [Zobellia amurskyensis]MUH34340.1 cytochrome C oxidase subunit III [Zobellia amurskyensis]